MKVQSETPTEPETEEAAAPIALTREQSALVARFAEELEASTELVLEVALRELAGRLHRFQEHGEVTLGHVNPNGIHVDWRPNHNGYVEFLIEQFANGEPVPPPAVLGGYAISGRHRLHAARKAGMQKVLAYRVKAFPKGDPRHLVMVDRRPRGRDPVRELRLVPSGVKRRIARANLRAELKKKLRRLGGK